MANNDVESHTHKYRIMFGFYILGTLYAAPYMLVRTVMKRFFPLGKPR